MLGINNYICGVLCGVITYPCPNFNGGRAKLLLDFRGRLNKKDRLTRYGDSHVKDKTS